MPRNRNASHLVSIVVPTLNEALALPECLASIRAQDGPFDSIVVDADSQDRTREIAAASGARVLQTRRGRAFQMNHGANETAGEILLFLHADSRLPAGALACVREAVVGGAVAGAFRLRLDRNGLKWRAGEVLANVYAHATRDLFGDRAIFVTRSVFEQLGGFRPLALMEDLDFSTRLKRGGFPVRLLRLAVTTSCRRFDSVGIWRAGWWAWKLCSAFHQSRACDARAARFYLDVRR
jgi:rSAM/selenodomain-associated transferase 2